MISFGFWLAGILGKTLTQGQAKKLGLFVAIPLLLVVSVVLIVIGKAAYDRGIKEEVQQERDAEIATGIVKADRDADAKAAARLAETEAENKRLEDAMADAKAADPAKGQTPVGPVQQSYFDNLPSEKGR